MHTAIVTAADGLRARGFRGCVAAVLARAQHARALTRRGSAHTRAERRRRLARQLASGHGRCVKLYGRTPGGVSALHAVVRGSTKIELDFTAPGTNGNNPPAADTYLIKQSPHPIRDARDFATAQALCNGACRFKVTDVGTQITLTITALRPHTTYYYVIAALDNVTARRGPRSRATMAQTA